MTAVRREIRIRRAARRLGWDVERYRRCAAVCERYPIPTY